MKKRILLLMFTSVMLLSVVNILGQGSTTSGLNGTVTDASNQPIPGANVVAVHVPSGTQYGTITSDVGTFTLPYMRSGGPYKITVTFLGYKTQVMEDVTLALGEDRDINFKMDVADENLGEVVIVATGSKTFNSGRTGADNSISKEQMSNIPTLSRSFSDMTKLTPQSSGLSFAGRNSLYNNLSIDGSVFNNSFGLSSTPGGQTNSQPISLDAIEAIQVSMAPYDVRQSGFTGAGINAVTRSGTNEIKASVYTFFRNQDFIGTKVGDTKVTNDNFSQKQYGFRVGGPIIKNKLFFFINGEMERRNDPATNYLAGRSGLTGDNVSTVLASDLDALKDSLLLHFNYDPGEYENYKNNTQSDRFLVRLDYNLSKNHKLSLRYNYLKSFRDVNPSTSNSSGGRASGASTMIFSGNRYEIHNDINSVVLELNSVIGSHMSNNFIAGWTGFKDYRAGKSIPFPMVDILNAGTTWTSFGFEQFTANNTLNTDVYQVSDNFSMYLGKHSITAGASFEYFKFENGYMPQYYGYYRFPSLTAFYNNINGSRTTANAPSYYQLQYSAIAGDAAPMARLKSAQLGVYAQDEWKVRPNLKVTAGLRIDVPFYPGDLAKNTKVEAMEFLKGDGSVEKIDVSKLPKTAMMFSPRLGFNYDVFGDRTTQIRGGAGVFTGRIPFVWVSNQMSNNGLMWGKISTSTQAANDTEYPFDPNVNKYVPATATALASYEINATVENFKFPQVFRTDIGIDQKLPFGIVATLEGIYTKDLNAIVHRNANLVTPTIKVNDGSQRDLYPSNSKLNSTVTAAYVLDNNSNGYSYFLTGQLTKRFDFGLDLMAAYTYSETKDMSSNPGSTASSAFGYNNIVNNPNEPVIGYSAYDQPHKLVASVSYKIDYLKHASTGISLVYVGSRGSRYSYYYAGDINRDTWNNDLIYVPKNIDDIVLVPQANSTIGGVVYTDTRTEQEIWNQLDAFISQDDYLSKHRGETVERNGCLMPWTHQFDLRLTQDFYLDVKGKRNTLELTLDVLNVGNLLNSDWGVYKSVVKTQFLQFRNFDVNNTPSISFPYLDFTTKTPVTTTFQNSVGLGSRWQLQVGIRYIFE
jgi:hypothetical protein